MTPLCKERWLYQGSLFPGERREWLGVESPRPGLGCPRCGGFEFGTDSPFPSVAAPPASLTSPTRCGSWLHVSVVWGWQGVVTRVVGPVPVSSGWGHRVQALI